jgi:hypothetical protein
MCIEYSVRRNLDLFQLEQCDRVCHWYHLCGPIADVHYIYWHHQAGLFLVPQVHKLASDKNSLHI